LKVLLALHGYPPELVGGTENSARALARGLVRRGDEVCVVAGSMAWQEGFRTSVAEDADPRSGRTYRVLRIHRDDPFFDHWHKSVHPGVAREVVIRERQERLGIGIVLHVQFPAALDDANGWTVAVLCEMNLGRQRRACQRCDQ